MLTDYGAGEPEAGPSTRITISNNQVYESYGGYEVINSKNGMTAQHSYITFSNNISKNNDGNAFGILHCDQCTFTGNTSSRHGNEEMAYIAGFYVKDNVTNLTISNNTSTDEGQSVPLRHTENRVCSNNAVVCDKPTNLPPRMTGRGISVFPYTGVKSITAFGNTFTDTQTTKTMDASFYALSDTAVNQSNNRSCGVRNIPTGTCASTVLNVN